MSLIIEMFSLFAREKENKLLDVAIIAAAGVLLLMLILHIFRIKFGGSFVCLTPERKTFIVTFFFGLGVIGILLLVKFIFF